MQPMLKFHDVFLMKILVSLKKKTDKSLESSNLPVSTYMAITTYMYDKIRSKLNGIHCID